MAKLIAILFNGLKKALAWCACRRNSADFQWICEVNQPETTAALKDNRLRQVATCIVAMLNEVKIYKNPNLALRELSNGLNTPSYIVTKAMNEVLGVNSAT